MLKKSFQYFCFPDRPIKGGEILDYLKGGNLRKGRVDLGKGSMAVLTNYAVSNA